MTVTLLDRALCLVPVTAAPAALSPIRRVIRAQLDLWGLPAVADLAELAELAATELVTNVIRHACDPRCTLTMQRMSQDCVEIAVHDCDTRMPKTCDADEFAESGRGLALLRLLSVELRFEQYGAAGKVVRCTLNAVKTS